VRTRKNSWPKTLAHVYSVEEIEAEYGNQIAGYNVVYSYSVGNGRYVGKFSDSHTSLRKGEIVSVRYCPEHPDRSFYPMATGLSGRGLIVVALGAGAALAVLFVLLSGR
jgi:hypothetical protein